jgi:DNA-directed RNA polymerase subunit RPC12/RpoP
VSYGLAICSVCSREVHADSEGGWTHCVDRTPICDAATVALPQSTTEIVGKWCGRDDFDRVHGPPPRADELQKACAHAPARHGGEGERIRNTCRKCGVRIARKAPAGAWKAA